MYFSLNLVRHLKTSIYFCLISPMKPLRNPYISFICQKEKLFKCRKSTYWFTIQFGLTVGKGCWIIIYMQMKWKTRKCHQITKRLNRNSCFICRVICLFYPGLIGCERRSSWLDKFREGHNYIQWKLTFSEMNCSLSNTYN